jgi:thioredoxin-like negative regulator of GroEL
MTGKDINGMTLNFVEVDCDKDTETSDKFNVKGFPTIKLVKGNQIIEYDAKPSVVNLIEFVNTSL